MGAFEDLDASVQSSAPILLYRVSQGASAWYYNTSGGYLTYDSHSWAPEAIVCSRIKRSGDLRNDDVTIKLPLSNALSVQFLTSPPDTPTIITRMRYQPSLATAKRDWRGTVLRTEPEQAAVAFICQPTAASILRPGLSQMFSRECRFTLGEAGCNVNRENYSIARQIAAVSGRKVRILFDSDPGNLVGGSLKSNVSGVEMLIVAQATISTLLIELTLLHPMASLVVGSSVRVYPGCDGSLTNCTFYGNRGNFGGWAGMRFINPFSDIRSIFS
jgi:hypothetical protein